MGKVIKNLDDYVFPLGLGSLAAHYTILYFFFPFRLIT